MMKKLLGKRIFHASGLVRLERSQYSDWATRRMIRCSNPVTVLVFISSPKRPDRFCGLNSFLFKGYRGYFHRTQSGRGVRLNKELHLVSRLRISKVITVRCISTFIFTFRHRDGQSVRLVMVKTH
jgi:hypothetical protein